MSYSCPTCGTANPDMFIVCSHPVCPDGRDQTTYRFGTGPRPRPPVNWLLVLALLVNAVVWGAIVGTGLVIWHS